MSWQRYPNANYPEAYPEANMVKATDVATNSDAGLLTVTEAGAGFGPLQEVTGADVQGTTLHDNGVAPVEVDVEDVITEE